MSWFSDGFDYIANGIGGLFGSGEAASTVADVAGDVATKKSGDSLFGSIGSALLSKEGIAGMLGAGNTYMANSMANDLQEEQYKRQTEADKFKSLLDLEKLKYQIGSKAASSSGSGGSNSSAQNRATLISALASAKGGQSNALSNLSSTLGGIYGR